MHVRQAEDRAQWQEAGRCPAQSHRAACTEAYTEGHSTACADARADARARARASASASASASVRGGSGGWQRQRCVR